MTQNPLAPLNPATTSGSDLATKLVNFEQSLLEQHSGASRPSYAQAGTIWLDTTTTPWIWKLYDGTSDIGIFAFSATSHRIREPAGETSLTSAATTDVLGAASSFIAISGSTTITSFGSEPNQIKFVRATSIFTIQHNAVSLVLPTAANITTEVGDSFIVISNAAGNARVMAYQRSTGAALAAGSASVPAGSVMLFRSTAAPTGWTKDTINYNDHAIRIVTGTVAPSGGSLNFSTVFGYTATQNYTLTTADIPSHSHGATGLTGSVGTSITNGSNVTRNFSRSTITNNQAGGGGNAVTSVNWDSDNLALASGTVTMGGSTASAGNDGSHAHNIDMRCRYVDAIFATKD